MTVVSASSPDALAAIVSALRAGETVVVPTDTLYGLAALPTDEAAIDRLFAVKGRGPDTPLAVLCADSDQALSLASPEAAAEARPVADRFWPGPLTLVLPRRAGVGLHLGEPANTIGLRVPDHALIHAIARAVGPIAVTSANRHGEPPLTSASAVVDALGSGVALVVDAGELAAAASTVVDATRADWRVLREGPISAAEVVASRTT